MVPLQLTINLEPSLQTCKSRSRFLETNRQSWVSFSLLVLFQYVYIIIRKLRLDFKKKEKLFNVQNEC